MTKTVSGKELQEGLLRGVNKLNDGVSSTLGPWGRTVLIKDESGVFRATKDGVSVSDAFIQLEDPVEDFGVQLVRKVATKSAIELGDGTTTSTLLAASLINEGYKTMDNGSNPVLIKKGIDIAVTSIIEKLKEYKLDITEESQLTEIATISGNNDEEIGVLITTALNKVGREGIVSIQQSKTGETELEIVEGMQFDRGYKSPYFVTDNNSMQAVLEEPYILIYDGRITKMNELVQVLNHVSIDEKSILIIAEDVDGEALSGLVVNKMRGIVDSVAVKAPDYGERRTQTLEDLAIITGGKVLSKEKGHNLEKLDVNTVISSLGRARTITVTKDKTTIVDGKCNESELAVRAEEIKTQLEKSQSPFEKEKLQERLARLVGGVAVISVGGNSDLEIKEKKDRVEDALYATRAAIEEGILPGGGTALLFARKNIKFGNESKDIEIGKRIVYEAAGKPFSQILTNAGIEPVAALIIANKLVEKYKPWMGYNISTEKFVNMKENGILDPMKVTKTALTNASSVAGTLLSTSVLVFEEVKEPKQQEYSGF